MRHTQQTTTESVSDDMIHLHISLIDLLVIKTSQHPHALNISRHKEQIRLLLFTRPELRFHKQLVNLNLIIIIIKFVSKRVNNRCNQLANIVHELSDSKFEKDQVKSPEIPTGLSSMRRS